MNWHDQVRERQKLTILDLFIQSFYNYKSLAHFFRFLRSTRYSTLSYLISQIFLKILGPEPFL